MVSPVLRERRHSFGFLVSEEHGDQSRDQVTLLKQVPPAPPSAPTLTAGASGSMPAQTVYVIVTYVGAFGETLGSAEASVSVASATGDVVVSSPATAAAATGYNVYAATASGAEVLQNIAPIAIGTAYTLTAVWSGVMQPRVDPPNEILPAGLILGVTLDGTSATYAANSGNTGTFTCGTVSVGQGVVEGIYAVQFIAATVFNVFAPNGALVGEGHTGAAFSVGGLTFTLTAGGTAAVVGDGATITLAANTNVGLYAPLNPLAADGTQTAAAILANETDASQGNTKVTAFTRSCPVNGSELIYPAAVTASQIAAINATLQGLGIVVR